MLAKLNPFIRYAGVVDITNNTKKNSIGYDHRLFYCTCGLATVTVDTQSVSLSAGTLIYIPAYTCYRFDKAENHSDVIIISLNFDLTDKNFMSEKSLNTHAFETWNKVKTNTEEIPKPFTKPLVVTDLLDVEKELTKITSLFFQQNFCYREFSSVILKNILLRIITKIQKNDISALANDIITYIRARYHEKITNQDIAKHFNYHPYHLSRVMHQTTGMRLKAYILAHRIKVAKNLLISTGKSITEIAMDCGFSDLSYFSKTFAKSEGVTPLKYRKEARNALV